MSLHSSQFYNFNQMLVISVFVHCLMLTIVLFMPKTEWVQEKIRPVFTVDLVEVPAIPGAQPGDLQEEGQKQKAVAPPQQEKTMEAPVAQKPLVKKPSATKPEPKPVPEPKSNFSTGEKSVKVDSLPFADTSKTKAGQSLSTLEQLDQVAKLPPTAKQTVNKKSSPTLLEDSLRELDALKTPSQSPGEKKKPGPSRVTEALKGFDTLQMEKHVPIEMPQPNPVPKKQDMSLEELEFAMLVERKIQSGTPDTTVTDRRELLDKLEELQKLKKSNQPVVIQKKTDTKEFETLIVQQMASTQQVLDKIASLDKQHEVEVSFDMGESLKTQPVKFKSRIWAVQSATLGKGVKGQGTGAAGKQTFVYQGPVGQAQAADPLSQYVGRVHQQIYKNWRNPLGAGHSEVKVSFYIFRAGNIDQPELVASSGDEQLDKLALMAVKDSAPFPGFPSALKEPNLHITINFKYIAKK